MTAAWTAGVWLLAAVSSLLLTGLARRAAVQLGFLDRPGGHKVHSRPVPLLGGLAVYLATLAACAVGWWLHRGGWEGIWAASATSPALWLAAWVGASGLLGLGILDDRGRIHAQLKLVAGMPAAAVLIVLAGGAFVGWPLTTLLGEQPSVLRLTSIVATVAIVTAVTAAFNIFDHMDGLSSGIAAISAAGFALLALRQGELATAVAAAALSGAALGFLAWNLPPARIFMGDAGALFLGLMLVFLCLRSQAALPPGPTSTLAPWLFLGVPLFDAALVTVSRLRRGLNPFSSPGTDHTAHRLESLGLSQGSVVLILYGIQIVLGLLGFVILTAPRELGLVMLAGVVMAAVVAIAALEWIRSAPQDRPTSAR